jgi:hypothetical protein
MLPLFWRCALSLYSDELGGRLPSAGDVEGLPPVVYGEGIAKPLVQKSRERHLRGERLSHASHEHDAAYDQLLPLISRHVLRNASDGCSHMGLDIPDVALAVRLAEYCHSHRHITT